jgi:TonB family protein
MMRTRHLCLLGGTLLLGGCLQRGVPETQAPAPDLARSSEAFPADAGRVPPCPERLRSPPVSALSEDGGVPQKVLEALGADGGGTTARGSLDKGVIREIIQGNRGDVLACYDNVLQREPHTPPRGKVAVRFVISKTGDVCATELAQSTVNDLGLERCVLDAVATWRFPPPEGGGVVVVTYPFIFKPVVAKDGGSPAPADPGSE